MMMFSLIVFVCVLLSTTNPTGPPGGNETDLATSRRSSLDSGGLANVLMVTTTVGMLDGVHGHTTDLGPAVALDLVLVVSTASLQHGLVDPTASGDDADGGSVGRGDDLLGAGGQLDPGPLGVRVVGDDGGVVARGTGDAATVAGLLLEVADDGTLGHLADGDDVAHSQLSLPTAVDELAGVHAFASNEQLLPGLVAVRIAEVDDGQGCATAGIVDDVLDDTLDVAIALGKVDWPELGGALAVLGVGDKDGARSLPLGANHSTHPACCLFVLIRARTIPARLAEKT